MIFIYFVFWPIVKIVIFILKFIIEDILKQKYSDDRPAFKITDLNEYIKKVIVSDKEIQTKNVSEFFNNALNLKAVKVRDFMIPRTEIIAVDEKDSINDLKETINKTGYTKVIVYKSSIDNVIGY